MQKIENVLAEIDCCKLYMAVPIANEAVLGFYNNLTYTPDDVVSLGKGQSLMHSWSINIRPLDLTPNGEASPS